jgi:hypothetical protein
MNAVSEQQAPTVTRALYAPIERKKNARQKMARKTGSNYHQLIPHFVSNNEENIYHLTSSGNNNHARVTQRFT